MKRTGILLIVAAVVLLAVGLMQSAQAESVDGYLRSQGFNFIHTSRPMPHPGGLYVGRVVVFQPAVEVSASGLCATLNGLDDSEKVTEVQIKLDNKYTKAFCK